MSRPINRLSPVLGRCWYSSKPCPSKQRTHPIDSSSKVIRHLQFTKLLPFEKGLKIQEKFVRAQLDMKQLQSKISRKLAQLEEENVGATVNQHEQAILNSILEMKPNPVVLTFEFEPTYTGGKRIKKTITPEQLVAYENFVPELQKENPKPKFVQVERGGQVTFHGPGQLVAYVILDLKSFHKFPAKCLVSGIEAATISSLKKTPIDENKTPLNLETKTTNETGVWTSQKEKIASIGIHVRRSVTSHGVSINISPDLSYMNHFTMCGLPQSRATSVLEQVPTSDCTVNGVGITFVNELAKVLGIGTVERIELEDLDIEE